MSVDLILFVWWSAQGPAPMVYVGPNNPYGVVAPPKHGIGSGELPANGGNPYAQEIYR